MFLDAQTIFLDAPQNVCGARWMSEAEKTDIKDAKKPETLPAEVELTKEEKIEIELQKFQEWCVSTIYLDIYSKILFTTIK